LPVGLATGSLPDGWFPGIELTGLRRTVGKLPEFCKLGVTGWPIEASCSFQKPLPIPGEAVIRIENPQFVQKPLVVSH
jgi:hypothetical protein